MTLITLYVYHSHGRAIELGNLTLVMSDQLTQQHIIQKNIYIGHMIYGLPLKDHGGILELVLPFYDLTDCFNSGYAPVSNPNIPATC